MNDTHGDEVRLDQETWTPEERACVRELGRLLLALVLDRRRWRAEQATKRENDRAPQH